MAAGLHPGWLRAVKDLAALGGGLADHCQTSQQTRTAHAKVKARGKFAVGPDELNLGHVGSAEFIRERLADAVAQLPRA